MKPEKSTHKRTAWTMSNKEIDQNVKEIILSIVKTVNELTPSYLRIDPNSASLYTFQNSGNLHVD